MNIRNKELLYAGVLWAVWSFMAIAYPGTGDDGDSILHYLYARYAFLYPENFFNHWAKPLYVMAMAPFAQFGFTATKLANALITGLALYCTLKTARVLGITPTLIPAALWAGIPMLYSCMLSGLTEPLFALLLSWTIWNAAEEKWTGALVIASFLPFVRSEGLVLMPVLAGFIISRNQWRRLPLLLSGHLIMGVAGWPVYGDPLWVFTRIPYAGAHNDSYGHGNWDYYFHELMPALGLFVYGCLLAGALYASWRLSAHLFKKVSYHDVELWLVLGQCAAFFTAHIIFWKYGLFNSFGLIRVFTAVVPLMVLVAARPLAEWYRHAAALGDRIFIWLPVSAGLLIGLYYHQDWSYRLKLTDEQMAYRQLALSYKDKLSQHRLYADAVYPLMELGKDYFSREQYRQTNFLYNGDSVPAHASVIWDHRFSVIEAHVDLSKVRSDPRFHLADVFNVDGKPAIYLFSTDSLGLPYQTLKNIIPGHGPEGTTSTDADTSAHHELRPEQEFLDGINLPCAELPAARQLLIRIRYRFSEGEASSPKLVWTYEDSEGKTQEWYSADLMEPGAMPGRWNEFMRKIELRRNEPPGRRLKIYVWNEKKARADISDFSIHY